MKVCTVEEPVNITPDQNMPLTSLYQRRLGLMLIKKLEFGAKERVESLQETVKDLRLE